jgi:hypothetical protein
VKDVGKLGTLWCLFCGISCVLQVKTGSGGGEQCGEGLGDQSRCGRLGRKVGTNHIGNDWSLRKSRLLSDHPKLARGKWGGLHSDRE